MIETETPDRRVTKVSLPEIIKLVDSSPGGKSTYIFPGSIAMVRETDEGCSIYLKGVDIAIDIGSNAEDFIKSLSD
ncbi:MAG: hypothetical protein DRP85_03145 [Candidatus Makaraimicrobium thalassicum]|nr:MAG: hypothetical protein DRP85_03145 [Candidatus Omnitrophota bacterium]